MSDPGGFDHISTAAAVRDTMKQIAGQVVQQQAPKPNIGRVISVNLASLVATVWFPGDDAPISVNLFANNIPQQWHDQFDDGTGMLVNTDTSGYGSMVAVETLNGKPYITEVLTGSQFAFDQRTLDMAYVTQEATDINASTPNDLVGKPNETFINCHVSSTTLTSGQAINFGPFLRYDGTEAGVGSLEITVTWGGASKHFQLTTSPLEDFDHPGNAGVLDQWMGILPDRTANNSNSVGYDFDLDVCVKKTLYGNIDDFTSGYEVWFRIVRRDFRLDTTSGLSNPSAGMDAYVSIRSTAFQRGRAITGRQLFMQETQISPPVHHGYLGWHDARMIWHDTDNDSVYDDFGRIVTNSWGLSDSSQSWGVFLGASSQWSVDGSSAILDIAANTTLYQILNSQATGPVLDMTFKFWVTALPTGAGIEVSCTMRRIDANNYYLVKAVLLPAGTVTLSFSKIVAGVTSTIGTDVTSVVTGVTNSSILRLRGYIKGSTLQAKAWLDGTNEPEAWAKVETDASIALGASQGTGITFNALSGNTNSKPYRVRVDEYRADMQGPTVYQDSPQWRTGPWRSGHLRAAADLQKTWQLDGVWTWTGSKLSWTGAIYFGGIGSNRQILKYGVTKLTMPDVGDKVRIAGSTSYTMDGSGIFLGLGETLWVSMPPEADWRDLSNRLFIVRPTTLLADYQVPEWAVLIASHQYGSLGQAPSLRLGNGDLLDNWRGATNLNGWTGSLRFRRESSNVVRLQGNAVGTAKTANTILTLPVGFRPGNAIFVPTVSNGAFGFITIGTNGDVVFQAGSTVYTSLDGITFVAEG